MVETQEAIRSENPHEEIKRALSALLMAFKEVVGDSQWLSLNGSANNEDFCLAFAVNERAEELQTFVNERFIINEE